MGGKTLREAFNVLELLLDVRRPMWSGGGALNDVLTSAVASSPMRCSLERRSPDGFLRTLLDRLRAEGLEQDEALAILDEVVNRPVISARRGDRESGRSEIMHGLLVDAGGPALGHLITIEVTVTRGKPPSIDPATARADALPIKLGDDDDLSDMLAHLESLWTSYGVRQVTPSPNAGATRMVVLGDPSRCGYLESPADWPARIRAMAGVLGMTADIVRTPGAARSQDVSGSPDLVIVINGSTGWESAEKRLAMPAIRLGLPGTRFADLLSATRVRALQFARESAQPPFTAPRDLGPGEVVYHRKVGDSGGGHDQFDAGSATACLHGSGSYTPWRSADKAFKGLQRRYPNLTKEMVYHCEKYPNCHVYCVKRKRH